MFIHVKDAKYIKDYQIEVLFDDGKKGIADLSDSLKGSVFKPLRDKTSFSHLKVDKELQTITWPNGADLAPEYLYFKAFHNEPGLQKIFKQWGYIA